MPAALPIAMGVGAGSSLLGGLLGGGAAKDAAETQAATELHNAQLQQDAQNQSLQWQKDQYNTGLATQAPWLNSGRAGLANLNYLLGINQQGMSYQDPQQVASAAQAPTTYDPRYIGKDYGGGLFGSWGGSQWEYQGRSGDQDIYSRINGSPAWNSYGPGGWQRGGAGSYTGQFDKPPAVGQPGGAQTPQSYQMSDLVNPNIGGFGSLMTPFSQTNWQTDPGYQFRLTEGQKAIERSAAARGNLVTGGTAKALDQYTQNFASNEYGNAYNRYNMDQTNKYNRMAALSGVGQMTAQQVANSGAQTAGAMGNILMQGTQQQTNSLADAANARASGFVGSANALNGAMSGIGNAAMGYGMLNYLRPNQSGYPMHSNSNIGAGQYDPYGRPIYGGLS